MKNKSHHIDRYTIKNKGISRTFLAIDSILSIVKRIISLVQPKRRKKARNSIWSYELKQTISGHKSLLFKRNESFDEELFERLIMMHQQQGKIVKHKKTTVQDNRKRPIVHPHLQKSA